MGSRVKALALGVGLFVGGLLRAKKSPVRRLNKRRESPIQTLFDYYYYYLFSLFQCSTHNLLHIRRHSMENYAILASNFYILFYLLWNNFLKEKKFDLVRYI